MIVLIAIGALFALGWMYQKGYDEGKLDTLNRAKEIKEASKKYGKE